MFQLRCIATWGHQTPSQSSSALTETPPAKFEVGQPISCCLMAFHCWYLTLCSDLDLWPLTLNISNVSPMTWWNAVPKWTISGGVIDDLAFFKRRGGGRIYKLYSSEESTKLRQIWEKRDPSLFHQTRNFGTGWLLRFEMRAAQRKSGIDDRGQISHFLTHRVKIKGGWGECWAE